MVAEIEGLLIELSVEGEEFEVETLRGTLAVSQLFCLSAHTLATTNAELVASSLVGKDYVLSLTSRLGDTLTIHGVVGSVMTCEDGNAEGLVLDLYPRPYL